MSAKLPALRYLGLLLALTSLVSLFGSQGISGDGPADSQKEGGHPTPFGKYVPDELLLTFQTWVTKDEIEALATSHGITVLESSIDGRVYKVQVAAELLGQTLEALTKEPNIALAQPNYLKGFEPLETAIQISPSSTVAIESATEKSAGGKASGAGKKIESDGKKPGAQQESEKYGDGMTDEAISGEWTFVGQLQSTFGWAQADTLSWQGGKSALQNSVTTITLDEATPYTVLDGLTISGVTFSFSVGGTPSADAQVGPLGPGNTPLMKLPVVEGIGTGTIGLTFANPPTSINYSFALMVSDNVSDASTLKLFDSSDQLISTFVGTASVPGSFWYAEGIVGAPDSVPIERAEITFSSSATHFALDTVQLNAGAVFVPPTVPDDDHGNKSSSATRLTAGQPANGDIQAVGDVDFFSFEAEAGVFYVVDTALGSLADTFIILYDTDGSSALANDDDGGSGLASQLAFQPQASGVYFVEVRPFVGSQQGGYSIRAAALAADDGDTSAAATALVLGQDRFAQIDPVGDVDFFSFSAEAGQPYNIGTQLISLPDSVISLYDVDGVTLLDSDDDSGPGLASSLTFGAPTTGTYFVAVRAFAADEQTGVYVLTVDEYTDDHGNQSSAATSVVPGEATAGDIEAVGDVDFFSFEAEAGISHVVETALGSLEDTIIILYDVDGVTLLDSDDDSGPGLASRLAFQPGASGVYFVKVRPFDTSQLGDYTITVTAVATDDGDDAGMATALVVGQERLADIDPAGDVDFFSFAAGAGLSYSIFTQLTSLPDSEIFLYDVDGATVLDSDDDSGPGLASSLPFSASQSGTYFVEVRSSVGGQTGVYALTVVEYSDDHGNQSSAATSLSPDVETAGVLEVTFDLDYFSFDAAAGSYYVLTTGSFTSLDTVLTLYDVDGTTSLAFDDDSGPEYLSQIIFKPEVGGTYFVAVGSFASLFSGSYTVTLNVIADDHENTSQGSTALTSGVELAGEIEVDQDVDTFSFSASMGSFYVIGTALGTLHDTVISVLDPDGETVLATDDDSGPGLASTLVFEPSTTATHFVQTRAFKRIQTGTYAITVTSLSATPPTVRLPTTPGPVVPDDTFYANFDGFAGDSQKWYLGDGLLRAESAWGFTQGDSTIVVAVIDSGVDLDHPDLDGRIWVNGNEIPANGLDDDGNGFVDDVNGWDFRNGDNDPNPDGPPFDSHGTWVAGTLGAVTDNGIGVSGVLWEVQIMPIKVFGATGGATDFDILNALTYAIQNGADVINLSLGLVLLDPVAIADPLSEEKITEAHDAGVVVVVAAGNHNGSLPSSPASATHAISVGASDHGSESLAEEGFLSDIDGRAPFSAFGEFVDVVAPGRFIRTTGILSGDGSPTYSLVSGTSFSAPLVSGLAGLVLARGKSLGLDLTSDQVRAIIEGTAVDLPDDGNDSPNAGPDWDGKGMVDFYAALQAVTASTVPGAPTDVSAIPSDVSAVVSWTAPTSDGGNPITGYAVTSDPGGVTATTASTSVTVTGLTQNTAYTFTVTATNAAGTSESSEPSPSVITKLTNIWDAPSTSGWGLAALVTGMLVVMVIALGLTSGSRRGARS